MSERLELRMDCPWKCRTDDAKCVCAASQPPVDGDVVERAALAIKQAVMEGATLLDIYHATVDSGAAYKRLANSALNAAYPALLARIVELEGEKEKLQIVLEKIKGNTSYSTGIGTLNCRFCDNNLDHEGTYREMHATDCIVHSIRLALSTTSKGSDVDE